MPVKKGPDGRKFHMSNTGVDLVVDSSESEEEVPPSRPATTGSVTFANVINEAKAGTKNTRPITKAKAMTKDARSIAEARPQNTPASRSHFQPGLAAQAAVHNWMPESHPAEGTQAHATLEKNIRKNRDGLLRAAVKVCKTGHVVLVMHWSSSDPLNRRGTWSLEVFDCRLELWGDFGIEAHEQCRSLSTADDIVRALAKAMMEKWEPVLPNLLINKEKSKPDDDKRELLNEKFNIRSLPSLRELERELRRLAVYAVGQLPRGQGGGHDDQNDKDENNKKNNGNQKDQKATKDDLQAQRKAAQERARLAHLRKIMDDRKGRQDLDRDHLGKLDVITREAQRRANGTGGVWNSDSRSFIPRSSVQGASLTDEFEHVPTTPSRTNTDGQKNKPAPKKAAKTDEEDADLKRIRAAARKDREREEQEERAEEERQRELATQKEDAELRERAALENTDSDDEDINAAVVDALESGSFEPEESENEPSRISQEETDEQESTTASSIDEPGPKDRKQRHEPRASTTPVTPHSSETNSVKPPQPSTPIETEPKAKSKAKPANPKATNETKNVKTTRESQVDKTKNAKTKEPNASKAVEKKNHKSEEFISTSDVDDDETNAVKLSSDTLQAENLSVETTQTTSTTVHSTHGTNPLPSTSPPPSPALSLKDSSNTPTTALDISIAVHAASERPRVSKKHKDPSCVGQGIPSPSPANKKRCRIAPSCSSASVEGATASVEHATVWRAGSCGAETETGKKRRLEGVGSSPGSKRMKGEESLSSGVAGGEEDMVYAGLIVGLDDVEKGEGGDGDDGGSWDSLFDE